MMNVSPPLKPPWGYPEATPRLSGGYPEATPRLPGGYPEATPRLSGGYPEATLRLPRGYPEATPRLPRGYPEATPRLPRDYGWATSVRDLRLPGRRARNRARGHLPRPPLGLSGRSPGDTARTRAGTDATR